MKYIRTKDRILEKIEININDIGAINNLSCDFELSDGTLRFWDYFPKKKLTLDILKNEIKNVVFTRRTVNWDRADYDYEIIDKKHIISQANTIEELCDAYIGIYKKTQNIVSLSKELDTLQDCKIIYGAIWTEWGLKYVAEMNEKGELELL